MSLRLFESLPSEPFVRMALVLLHSIWQASLLAALLWLALRVFAADRPQARYRLSVAVLAMVVGMAVFTWSFLGRPATVEVLGSGTPWQGDARKLLAQGNAVSFAGRADHDAARAQDAR